MGLSDCCSVLDQNTLPSFASGDPDALKWWPGSSTNPWVYFDLRALFAEPLQAPTEIMLRHCPELLAYRAISVPPSGWSGRRLGWKATIVALMLDEGERAIALDEYPVWWPWWPLRKTDTLSVRADDGVPSAMTG
jgi:hypothetical protein